VRDEQTRRVVPQDLYALQFVGDPQPSPDGSRIAFVVAQADEEENDDRSRIWLVATDSEGEPTPLTAGSKKDASPRWSPDGARLVFVSNRAEETPHLWLLDLRGGEARQLTRGKEPASDPVWSPDGARIAYVAHIGGEQPPEKGADEKTKRAWENRIRTITRRKYKHDGDDFWDGGHDHLCVIPAAGGERTQLTDGDWDDGQPAWSPDDAQIAFISYREEDRDRVARADLWTVPAAGGAARKLTLSDGEASAPAWAPDGRTIAFLGHNEGDKWAVTTRVWTVPADTSAPPRCLTRSLDRHATTVTLHDQTTPDTANPPLWSADGATIHFLAADSGNDHLYAVSASGGDATRAIGGEWAILAARSLPDGRFFLLATDATTPAELFVTDGTTERQRTHMNRAWLESKEVRAPERFRVQGDDEHEIDCWLLTPPDFTDGGRYPLVLEIHGGPQAQYANAFFHEMQVWAAAGYLVLYTNPHGSIGYSERFTEELRRHYGEKDMPDLMAALDAVIARGIVDERRIGVTGGSYGGFMVNWLIGQTDRFAAGITQRCVSNWASDYGTSDLSMVSCVEEFGGPPWEAMETYLRLSPLTYVGNMRTPLHIEQQEHDYRCAMEQAEQMFMALKARDVPVEFVRYPNESHALSRSGQPHHRVERLTRHLAWFAKYLGC
jgi:dipeptidyl aminopeptidase/acylaminoacyl peptidase